jgi:hypothetical protein
MRGRGAAKRIAARRGPPLTQDQDVAGLHLEVDDLSRAQRLLVAGVAALDLQRALLRKGSEGRRGVG